MNHQISRLRSSWPCFWPTFLCLCISSLPDSETLAADQEQVTFFACYGVLQGEEWVITIRLRVSEPRPVVEASVQVAAQKSAVLTSEEAVILRERIAPFVSDSESGERVEFIFDGDPEETRFVPSGNGDQPIVSDGNGLVTGQIRMSVKKAAELLEIQKSKDAWLRIRAVSQEHQGIGWVQLISPNGLSVISDVDDTIRITEIHAGAETVVRNTITRPFRETPGMPKRYRELNEAAFHYVSASPTQLYEPLWKFVTENDRYPRGSFHMRPLGKNLREQDTWKQLMTLVSEGASTADLKTNHIEGILADFPDRTFILIGDSGESDPEIYRTIQKKHPAQIREIWIRDVGDHTVNPDRCGGMTII
ncbi:MAG: phosphatidate phosphatase App1 family protein, partial [Planctomycetota bacterium]